MSSGPSPDAIRGITRRDVLMWMTYRALARGDFRHDFGEGTDTRDLIVPKDGERFFEIAKLVSTKGQVWLLTQFNKYINQTLYSLLNQQFDNVLVPQLFPAPDAQFLGENELLQLIGIDYLEIKAATSASGPTPIQRTFAIPGGPPRSYTIRSSSYRQAARGEEGYKMNRNISTMFREVSGNKSNRFALIIDATGGLPLSELLNSTLQPQPDVACEFFIIENIENASDSADKVQHIKAKEGGIMPKLSYLRDMTGTVVYPLWDTPDDQKSNIFASMKVILNRQADGSVEAVLTVGPESFQIGDVANASNVKNATLKALSVMIEKGVVAEVFAYTLIKRMGDWCQALSLLDLDRMYDIVSEGQTAGSTTLSSMLADTEVGIVTNDRILLAFCILHGLNVFFTSAMDIARLIYFKNDNDVPSGDLLGERATKIYAEALSQYTPLKDTLDSTSARLSATIAQAAKNIVESTTLPDYIYRLKVFTSNMSILEDITFKTENDQIQAGMSAFTEANDFMVKFNAANIVAARVARLEINMKKAEDVVANIAAGTFIGAPTVRIRLDALARRLQSGGRAPNSVEIVESKDIVLSTRGDIELMTKNNIYPRSDIAILLNPMQVKIPEGRASANYTEVIGALDPVKLLVVIEQTGGGPATTLFNSLRKRQVRLLPKGTEKTSTINTYTIGDDYYDESLNAYTVADEYIVTRDDIPTFTLFFNRSIRGEAPIEKYICLKYVLLCIDRLRQSYERFLDEYSETFRGLEVEAFTPGNATYDTLMVIVNELAAIQGLQAGFSYDAVRTYRGMKFEPVPRQLPTDALVRQGIQSLRAWVSAECQAIYPSSPPIPEAINAQRIYERSDYYAQLVLRVVASKLQTRTDKILTVQNGVPTLTQEGEELNTWIRLTITSQNDEDVAPRPDGMNAQVADALTKWLTARRPQSDIRGIVYAVTQQLTTVGGRKTYRRRRLPKLL